MPGQELFAQPSYRVFGGIHPVESGVLPAALIPAVAIPRIRPFLSPSYILARLSIYILPFFALGTLLIDLCI